MAENVYVCSQCGKGFKYKRNLTSHERSHAVTLPFSCCGKGFASRRDLEGHITKMLSVLLLNQLNELRLNNILCDLELVARDNTSFHVHQIVFIALNRRHFQLALDRAKDQDNSTVLRKMYLGSLTSVELKLVVEFMYGSTVRQKSKYCMLAEALKKVDMTYLMEKAGEFTLEDDEISIKTEAENLPLEDSSVVNCETTEQTQNLLLCENTNKDSTSEKNCEVERSSVVLESVQIKKEPLSAESNLCINRDIHHDSPEKNLSENADLEGSTNAETTAISENFTTNSNRIVTDLDTVTASESSDSEYTEMKTENSPVKSLVISSGKRCMYNVSTQNNINQAVVSDSTAEASVNMQDGSSLQEEVIVSSLSKKRKLLPKPVVYVYPGPPPVKLPLSSVSSTVASRVILPASVLSVSANTSATTQTSPVRSVSTSNLEKGSATTLASSVSSASISDSTKTPALTLTSSVSAVSASNSTKRLVPTLTSSVSSVLTSNSTKRLVPTLTSSVSSFLTSNSTKRSVPTLTSSGGLDSTWSSAKRSVPSLVSSALSVSLITSTAKPRTVIPSISIIPSSVLTCGSQMCSTVHSRTLSESDSVSFTSAVTTTSPIMNGKSSVTPDSATKTVNRSPSTKFKTKVKMLRRKPLFKKSKKVEKKSSEKYPFIAQALKEPAKYLELSRPKSPVFEKEDGTEINDSPEIEVLVESAAAFLRIPTVVVVKKETDRSEKSDTSTTDGNKVISSSKRSGVVLLNKPEASFSAAINDSDTQVETESQKCIIPSSEILTLTFDNIIAAKRNIEMDNSHEKNAIHTPDKNRDTVNVTKSQNRYRQIIKKNLFGERQNESSKDNEPPTDLTGTKSSSAEEKATVVNSACIGRIESIHKSNEISSVKIVLGGPEYHGKVFQSNEISGNRMERSLCNQSKKTDSVHFNTDVTEALENNSDVFLQGDRDIDKENHLINNVDQCKKSALQNENTVSDKQCNTVALNLFSQESDLLTSTDKRNVQTRNSVIETESKQVTQNDDSQKTEESDTALHKMLEVSEKNGDDIRSTDKTTSDKESNIMNSMEHIEDAAVFVNTPEVNMSTSFNDFITPDQAASKACIIPSTEICTLSLNDIRAAKRKYRDDIENNGQTKFSKNSNEYSLFNVPKGQNDFNSSATSKDQKQKENQLNEQSASHVQSNKSESWKLKRAGNECTVNEKETTQSAEIKSESDAAHSKKQEQSDSNLSEEPDLLITTDKRNDLIDNNVQGNKTESKEIGIGDNIDKINEQVDSRYPENINTSEALGIERQAIQKIYALETDNACQDVDQPAICKSCVELHETATHNKTNTNDITVQSKFNTSPTEIKRMQPESFVNISCQNTDVMPSHKSVTNSCNILPKVPVTVIRFPVSMKMASVSKQLNFFPADKPVVACFVSPDRSTNSVEKEKVDSKDKKRRHKCLKGAFEKDRKLKRQKPSGSNEHVLQKRQNSCKTAKKKKKRSYTVKTKRGRKKSNTVEGKISQRQTENRNISGEEKVNSDEQNDNSIVTESSDTDADVPLSQLKERIISARLSNSDLLQIPHSSNKANEFETEPRKRVSEISSEISVVGTPGSVYETCIFATQPGSTSKGDDEKKCDESVKDHNYEINTSCNMKQVTENDIISSNTCIIDNLARKQAIETPTSDESESCPFIINENLDHCSQFQREENVVSEKAEKSENTNDIVLAIDDTCQQTGKTAIEECILRETDAEKSESFVDLTVNDNQMASFSVGIPGVIQECIVRKRSISDTAPELKKALLTPVTGGYSNKLGNEGKPASNCKMCNGDYRNSLINSESGLCHACLLMKKGQMDTINKKWKHSKNLLTKEECDSYMKCIQEKLSPNKDKRAKFRVLKQRNRKSLNANKKPANTVTVKKQSSKSHKQIQDKSLQHSKSVSVSSASQSVYLQGFPQETMQTVDVDALQQSVNDSTSTLLICDTIPKKVTTSLLKESTVTTARQILPKPSFFYFKFVAGVPQMAAPATQTSSVSTSLTTLVPLAGSSTPVVSTPKISTSISRSLAEETYTKIPVVCSAKSVLSPPNFLTPVLPQLPSKSVSSNRFDASLPNVPKPATLTSSVQRLLSIATKTSAGVSTSLAAEICNLVPVISSPKPVLSASKMSAGESFKLAGETYTLAPVVHSGTTTRNTSPGVSASLDAATYTSVPVVGSAVPVLSTANALTRATPVFSPANALTPVLPKLPSTSVTPNSSGATLPTISTPATLTASPSLNFAAELPANVSTSLATETNTSIPVVGSAMSVLLSTTGLAPTMFSPNVTLSTAVVSPVMSPMLSSNTRFLTRTLNETSPAPTLRSMLTSQTLRPVPRPSVLIFRSEVQDPSSLIRSETGTTFRKPQPMCRDFRSEDEVQNPSVSMVKVTNAITAEKAVVQKHGPLTSNIAVPMETDEVQNIKSEPLSQTNKEINAVKTEVIDINNDEPDYQVVPAASTTNSDDKLGSDMDKVKTEPEIKTEVTTPQAARNVRFDTCMNTRQTSVNEGIEVQISVSSESDSISTVMPTTPSTTDVSKPFTTEAKFAATPGPGNENTDTSSEVGNCFSSPSCSIRNTFAQNSPTVTTWKKNTALNHFGCVTSSKCFHMSQRFTSALAFPSAVVTPSRTSPPQPVRDQRLEHRPQKPSPLVLSPSQLRKPMEITEDQEVQEASNQKNPEEDANGKRQRPCKGKRYKDFIADLKPSKNGRKVYSSKSGTQDSVSTEDKNQAVSHDQTPNTSLTQITVTGPERSDSQSSSRQMLSTPPLDGTEVAETSVTGRETVLNPSLTVTRRETVLNSLITMAKIQIKLDPSLTVTDGETVPNQLLTMTGGETVLNPTLTVSRGQIKLDPSLTVAGGETVLNPTFTVSQGQIKLDPSSTAASGETVLNPTLTVSQGQIKLDPSLTVASGETVLNPTLTVSRGQIKLDPSLTVAGGETVINPTLTVSQGQIKLDPSLTVAGGETVLNPTLTVSRGQIKLDPSLTVAGGETVINPTLTVSQGQIKLDPSLTVASGETVLNPTLTVSQGQIKLDPSLTVAGGETVLNPTLTVSQGQIKLDPSLTVSGAQTVTRDDDLLTRDDATTTVCQLNGISLPNICGVGDVLVLTKPLGTQVAVNAHEWLDKPEYWNRLKVLVTENDVRIAYHCTMLNMARPNMKVARTLQRFSAHAAKDVTGLSILRCANNLASIQKNNVSLKIINLPVIAKTQVFSLAGENMSDLLCGHSVEISGGLLIAFPRRQAEAFCKYTEEEEGYLPWIIGVVEKGNRTAYIVKSPRVIEIPSKNHKF